MKRRFLQWTLPERGEMVAKRGAVKTTIRERNVECRQCLGSDPKCSLCHGTGVLISELIVNIFPGGQQNG